jgi:3-oxoadipate enol-lactonase
LPWIEANTTSLRYETSGSGLTPLVLIHEMGGSLESWDEVIPPLAPRHQIIRYDLRGHGLSEKIRGPYLITDAVADLAALLDSLNMTAPAVIAGCALGGGIALQFAASQPKRVKAVVAMAPAIGMRPESRGPMLGWAAAIEEEGMRRFVDDEMLPSAWPAVLRTDMARFDRFRARQLSNDPSSYAATQRMLGACDVAADFARIKCPVLLLAGRHDVARPPDFVAGLAARLPDAKVATLESGHFMLVQTPELVSAAISGFVDGVSR